MFFFQSDNFNCQKFTKLMGYIYEAFYNSWSEEEDEFRSLVKQGDSIIRNEVFKPFLIEVTNRRGDIISSDREVAALGVEAKKSAVVEVSFKEGDSVTVTAGSFEGFTGIVDSLDMEAQTADVRVSMFGRETTVSLPLTQIKAEG